MGVDAELSLRRRIMFFVGLTMVILLVGLYLLTQRGLLNDYKALEQREADEGMNRVLLAFYDEYKSLDALANDYSAWDDTYQFVSEPEKPEEENPYLVENFSGPIFITNRMNITVLLNDKQQVVFAKAVDYNKDVSLPFPQTFITNFLHNYPAMITHTPDPSSRKMDLVMVDNKPVIVASYPILKTDYEGPVGGTLIFARFLDTNYIRYISEKVNRQLIFTPIDSNGFSDVTTTISGPGDRTLPYWTETDDTLIRSMAILSDIHNEPSVLLEYSQSRDIYQQAKKSNLFYLIYFVIFGCVFFLIVWAVLQRKLFSRVGNMMTGMNEIEMNKDFTIRLHETGKDEITKLQQSFNLMMSSLEHSQQEIHYQADHDILTGLANRKSFFKALRTVIKKSEELTRRFGVLYIDLDGFKMVNDTMGHHRGDLLLTQASERLKSSLNKGDFLYRLGGDEFCIISDHLSDTKSIEQLADGLKKSLDIPFELEGRTVKITGSIGISLYPDHGADAERLVLHSDAAMLYVKETGKDNYKWYTDEIENHRIRRNLIEHSLKSAIQNGELELYFQPKWNVHENRISGLEALLRWTSPILGPVSPYEFIPVAEATCLINELGEWTMRAACQQFNSWKKEWIDKSISVAINISGGQLLQAGFTERICVIFAEEKVDPRYFELEVTESFAIENFEEVIKMLAELREIGFTISIDDFGAGYSSMKYLYQLPVQCMKIDKALIDNLGDNARNQIIVSNIIALAHQLELTVVAEGVETEKQLDFLLEAGCDQIQGYFISKPMPAENIVGILNEPYRRVN